MPAARRPHDAGLVSALPRVHEQDRHVAVERSPCCACIVPVSADELPARRGEVAVGDVDRDALLALGQVR
jgi:hypothetical protein